MSPPLWIAAWALLLHGTAVVTRDEAALWTDSRYWTQAELELDCNWELQRTTSIESIVTWILKVVPAEGNVSLDPFLFSIDTWNSYSRALHGSGRTLLPLETNLVDQAWGDQRPLPSSSEIYSLPAEFTGSSWQEKVAGIRQRMEQHARRPTAVLLSGLEETAWLFNLRGDDIPYNPVFYSYTLLTNTTISPASPNSPPGPSSLLAWPELGGPKAAGDRHSISASGLNAALAHYSPSNGSSRTLSAREMYLFDTGGQYLDGTTDITRTVHWGEPTPLQKEAYTRVLMGNIDLSRLVFPSNTAGRTVESFARRALWDVGLNYGHGTGHGIGNFLSVHEWPVGFQSNNVPLEAGMFTSIEPGYYQDGEFGIRIEDVALVVEAQTEHQSGEKPFLTFEVVSLVPYDRNLIDLSLLSPEQIRYLNSYYERIRAHVGPELRRQRLEEAYAWLQESTEPFPVSSAGPAAAGSLALASLLSVLLSGLGV
ncbi:xaa-Pro aminopeptidase 2 [Geospiza fortis]|uniref:Xaa-Pro aminopeptidase 2 n=1 Tax=Geospiza fortis TaxID=48883 RepID=A0A8N5EWM1_GEOFO|nr:xaa-Pro aminopeptidase 2 [Geospiza fortis]